MTVNELLNTLYDVPGDADVKILFDDTEFEPLITLKQKFANSKVVDSTLLIMRTKED